MKSDPSGEVRFSLGPWVDAVSQVSGPDGDGDADDPEPVPVPESRRRRSRSTRVSESFAQRLARELLKD